MTATSSNPRRNPVTATPDPRTTPETAEEAARRVIEAVLERHQRDLTRWDCSCGWVTPWDRTTGYFEHVAAAVLAASTAVTGEEVWVAEQIASAFETAASEWDDPSGDEATQSVANWLLQQADVHRHLAATAVTGERDLLATTGVRDVKAKFEDAATAVTGQDERARISVPRPKINHDGGRPIEDDLREASQRVEDMRVWGSNKTATVAKLLRDAADACAAPSPAVTAAEDERERCERCGEVIPPGRSDCPADIAVPAEGD